jgi:hypothetical protein
MQQLHVAVDMGAIPAQASAIHYAHLTSIGMENAVLF